MVSSAVAPSLWEHELGLPELDRVAQPAVAAVPGAADGGATLDQVITRIWEAVMDRQQVTCPWCEGEMRPRYSAAPLPVGARCADCGASLA
jgi:hypothetical protein